MRWPKAWCWQDRDQQILVRVRAERILGLTVTSLRPNYNDPMWRIIDGSWYVAELPMITLVEALRSGEAATRVDGHRRRRLRSALPSSCRRSMRMRRFRRG